MLCMLAPASVFAAKVCPRELVAEEPVVPLSMEQADINSGVLSFEDISQHGEAQFLAEFNLCDGRSRPATTGGGDKRNPADQFISGGGPLETAAQLAKLRTSAFDSNSCAGCHNYPEPGGAGDFVANVFVLAQARDPVTLSVGLEFSDSRNTLGMQAEERFDMNPDKGFDPDFDEDGVQRELTVGDITAISIWQAQLSTPTQVLPPMIRGRRTLSVTFAMSTSHKGVPIITASPARNTF